MNLSVEEPFFLRGRLAGNITEQDAHAIHWLTAAIRRYDLKKVDQITLVWANQAPGAPSYVAGRCDRPPKRSRKIGFRLTAAAHGLPPYHVPIRKPPLYRKPDGVWQPAKSAARHAITWPNDILESLSAIELASERDAAERFRDEYQRHADGWVARLGEMRKTRDGQQWFGVGAILTLASLAEALVWQTSQTAFWWLRTTRQVAGRATDHGSHAFAGDMLAQYRAHLSREARHADEAANAAMYRDRDVIDAAMPGGDLLTQQIEAARKPKLGFPGDS